MGVELLVRLLATASLVALSMLHAPANAVPTGSSVSTVGVSQQVGQPAADISRRGAKGRLLVRITGLPGKAKAKVVVRGPKGFRKRLAASATLKGLRAGRYRVSDKRVRYRGNLYVASANRSRVTVTPGRKAKVWIDHVRVLPIAPPATSADVPQSDDPPPSQIPTPGPVAAVPPGTGSGGGSPPADTPTTPSGPRAVSLAAGVDHSCAVLDTGAVQCWGANTYGQLGNGSNTDSADPVAVTGVGSAAKIAAGDSFTCALLADASMRCWGRNAEGQLGDGTGGTGSHSNDSNTAVTVVDQTSNPLSGVTAIAAGRQHACAVVAGAEVHCWGFNNHGQIGTGSAGAEEPRAVQALQFGPQPSNLAAGDGFSCVLLSSSRAGCWGSNDQGRLGDRTDVERHVPVGVDLTPSATRLSSGTAHSCAVLDPGGDVTCWGDNTDGQLNGDHTPAPPDTSAVAPVSSGVAAAADVAAGGFHTCAQMLDGSVRCWGANWSGQLGQGSTAPDVPGVPLVPGLSGVQLLAAGSNHTCAASTDGKVRCWGGNASGQSGSGADPVTAPQVVPLG